MARPRKTIDETVAESINLPEPEAPSDQIEIEIGSGSLYCSCFIDKLTLNAHIEAGWKVKPQNFGK